MVPGGHEYLRLTPDRLVAPIGTQVVLKAAVAGVDGNLIPNERIEWSVARNGIGQLGDMGVHDIRQFFGWWEAPQRIDDWSAVGRTAYMPVSLDVGAADPSNDVQIERGQSWVTLTSCAEGTSLVTAHAPSLCEYNQATTAVYWIDAQWIFPASVVAECGRPHVLTTTVMRRTDGAPLAGWVVRYVVAGGGSLGYEGGNSTDVRTDASGRASVEVSPTGSGGGTTNVGITIIRPASVGPNALPQFELSRSAATVMWSAGAAPSVTTPSVFGPSAPMSPPPSLGASPVPQSLAPTLGPTSVPQPPSASAASPPPYTPPPSQPTGRPRLEIDLRPVSAEQVAVGEYVSYELTVTNRGNGTARNIKVTDRFDQGLTNLMDTENTHVIDTSLQNLSPNESVKLPRPLTFQVVGAGKQCHVVTLTADDMDPVSQQACATGLQAALQVKLSAIFARSVGQVAEFKVSVKNIGSTAVKDAQLAVQFDPVIEPILQPGQERQSNNGILIRLNGELLSGESRVVPFQGLCKQESKHACAHAAVVSGGANSVDDACFEILPVR
jgi:uncharacterized repeat protein (TIGR01451 family)